ncbi:MAG TPA: alpha/beta hydrolase [Polyangiaceae bacterium]
MTTKKRPPAEAVSESFAESGDGTRIYYRRRPGPSPVTAVLCDGLVCDGFIWKYLWDDLAAELSVAHFNYRGHGRSAPPADTEAVGVEAHAQDLDAVRRALGDPEVVLIGHSLGTQVALEAYRQRPERIAALVLICGSFGRVTYTFKGSEMLANVLPDLIGLAVRHPKLLRAIWSRFPPNVALRLAQLTGDVDPTQVRLEDVRPYFEHVANVDFEMFLRMLKAAGEHSAEDVLARVKAPVLVIAGAKDSFTPKAVSEAMAEAIPGAELEVLASGTHIAPLELSAVIHARIRRFLFERVLVDDTSHPE